MFTLGLCNSSLWDPWRSGPELDCRPLRASAGAWGARIPSAQHPDRAQEGAGTLTGLLLQVETTVYVIVRCKLDERVTTEAEFSPEDSPSVRVEAKLENEYTVSVKAPSK